MHYVRRSSNTHSHLPIEVCCHDVIMREVIVAAALKVVRMYSGILFILRMRKTLHSRTSHDDKITCINGVLNPIEHFNRNSFRWPGPVWARHPTIIQDLGFWSQRVLQTALWALLARQHILRTVISCASIFVSHVFSGVNISNSNQLLSIALGHSAVST